MVPIAGLDKIENAIACPPTSNPVRPPPALVAIFKQEILVGVIVGVGVFVGVAVFVGVFVGVIVGVIVGVTVGVDEVLVGVGVVVELTVGVLVLV